MADKIPHDKSSDPMPIIGLYIAAASVLCSLFMLYDIIHGFIKKQRWLPCKLFKLNSVTLSLIAVVVKLTVDLTTSMPSPLDQFSKLSGTMSLCVYMCYIFPSLGDMKDRTNMYALSILVTTVGVNLCIQIGTEVISSAVAGGNIIVLFFMLFLLVILWHFVLSGKNGYRSEIADCKLRFISGKGSFLWRLKVCYLRSYMSNPQFVACMQMDYCTVGDLSLFIWFFFMSFAIGYGINFEKGASAYLWSMKVIVSTQFFTISIGTFACYFRRFIMSSHVRSREIFKRAPIEEPYMSNPVWRRKFFWVKVVNFLYILVMFVNYWSVSIPVRLFDWLKSKICCASSRKITHNRTVKAFEDLGYKDYDEWILRKSVDDMEKKIQGSKKKTSNLCNLSRILKFSPRYQGPRPRDLRKDLRIQERLLSLTVLVRIIEVSLPKNNIRKTILETFRENFETLHFIGKHVHATSRKDREVAKALWKASGFRHLLPRSLRVSSDPSLPANHALPVIDYIYKKMGDDDVGREVLCIKEFVNLRRYSSVDELSYFMEDLFADLLDPMLAQLPEAILKAVTESPDDEFEKRVRQSLEHLCKFESWDRIQRWKLPKGCEHFPGLINPDVPSPQHSDQRDIVTGSPLNVNTTTDVPAVQDEGFNQQVSKTFISPNGSLSEGNKKLRRNKNLRREEHYVIISDDDAIAEMTLL